MIEDYKTFSKLKKYFPITTFELESLSNTSLLSLANGVISVETSTIQTELVKKAGYDSIMQIQVPQLKNESLYDEFAANLRELMSFIEDKSPLLFFYIPKNPFSYSYNRFNVTVELLKELLSKESNRIIVFYEESSKVLNMLLYALIGVVKEQSRIKVLSKNVGVTELSKTFSAAVNSMARLESERIS